MWIKCIPGLLYYNWEGLLTNSFLHVEMGIVQVKTIWCPRVGDLEYTGNNNIRISNSVLVSEYYTQAIKV